MILYQQIQQVVYYITNLRNMNNSGGYANSIRIYSKTKSDHLILYISVVGANTNTYTTISFTSHGYANFFATENDTVKVNKNFVAP